MSYLQAEAGKQQNYKRVQQANKQQLNSNSQAVANATLMLCSNFRLYISFFNCKKFSYLKLTRICFFNVM
jgi:hypothetical protein